MKIKICGIKTPEHAIVAASAGADFIGIIFAEHSLRCVTIEQAKIIVESIKNSPVIPVAVFADQTADKIVEICQDTQINVVQLHGDKARAAIKFLPSKLHVITAIKVTVDGKINLSDLNIAMNRTSLDDYIMFDAENGGSGKPFPWKKFQYGGKEPWFLSGGLNPSNVTEALSLLHPDGVDVSSGVESNKEKDPALIKKFIQVVRHYENEHSRK